jgi:hypothetical protein
MTEPARFSRPAERLANVGELGWVGEPPVGYHCSQLAQSRLGEEEPGHAGRTLVKPHQAALHQTFGGWRQLGLSRQGLPHHVLSWNPSATLGRVEKNISS